MPTLLDIYAMAEEEGMLISGGTHAEGEYGISGTTTGVGGEVGEGHHVPTSQIWCEQEHLLSSIYGFAHLSCSDLQAVSDVKAFADMILKFTKEIYNFTDPSQGEKQLPLWPTLSPSDFLPLSNAACDLVSSKKISWFPQYGCALVKLANASGAGLEESIDIAASDDVSLVLVGLDKWSFKTHSVSQGDIQHTASCEGSTVVHACTIPAEDFENVLHTLTVLLQKAQERKGEKRSAAGNNQGHQKTPAFLHALVLDAVLVVLKNIDLDDFIQSGRQHPPRGGFTDVGLHTGGQYRNTSWPLVKETFKFLLEISSDVKSPHELYAHAMAHFHLYLLNRQLALVTAATATPLMLNATMQMLQVAASQASELSHHGQPLPHFEAAVEAAKKRLDNVALIRASAAARKFELPSGDGGGSTTKESVLKLSYSSPSGIIPPVATTSATVSGLNEAIERSSRNTGSLAVPPTPTFENLGCCLKDLLHFLEHHTVGTKDAGGLVAQHVLCSIEAVLFPAAASGFASSAALSEDDVERLLVKIVEIYRTTLQGFMGTSASSARMRVKLYSREALVAFVAYCMIHAATARFWPSLDAYGVGLQYGDLCHLVLADRAACDAAQAVATYLRIHTNSVPIFTLRNQAPTFAMAEQYASNDPKIKAFWAQEQAAATAKIDAHWAEVQAHQEELGQLREDLRGARGTLAARQQELAEAEDELNQLPYSSNSYSPYQKQKSKVHKIKNTIAEARSEVSKLEKDIEYWGKPPVSVIQPLPKVPGNAYRWLFFLYMPPLFQALSRMSFLAQQLLLPRDLNPPPEAGWLSYLATHYNCQQSSQYHNPTAKREAFATTVAIVSMERAPEVSKVGPQHVDSFRSAEDGIWYPDSLDPGMGWEGSKSPADAFSGKFNPFGPVPHKKTVDFFTEKLSEEAKGLQWAMPQYGTTEPDRGNQAIARQESRPHWLSKPGYLDFGSLRAYPCLQLRKLCVALHERRLPLGHSTIQSLISQALYHLGELTDSTPPRFLWRSEWDTTCSDLLPTLCYEVASLADELAQMPRSYDSVALLGELAAYLSDWHAPFLPLARRLASMSEKWADDLEASVTDAATEDSKHVRAKQCLLRMTAQMCHLNGPLDVADCKRLLKLSVLIHHGRVFEEEDSLQKEISRMQVRCHHVMAKRIRELIAAINQDNSILTDAVRLILQRAPSDLAWRQYLWKGDENNEVIDVLDSGFTATGSDGHVYAVNILDGTVLLDGWPYQRLAKDIMEHSLYHRTFGAWNFEVAGSGVYQTTRPVRKRFYEFSLAKDGDLVIVEIDERGNKLQLLDVGENCGCGAWGQQLPVRLRELYSHWLCRESRALVLRPLNFMEHDTHFILQWEADSNAQVQYTCRRVPSHLRSRHWSDLLEHYDSQLTDHLVLHTSAITRVLSKFEAPQFIHCYVESTSSERMDIDGEDSSLADSSSGHGQELKLFELPRFGLEFELVGDSLLSLDYLGYRLAQQQQLISPVVEGYTLSDFQQYLILEQVTSSDTGNGAKAAVGTAHVPSRKVLIPAGQVIAHDQNMGLGKFGVFIEVPSASGAHVEAHAYDVHKRFSYLVANSILPRFQLAALYAATGSLLPEPGSQMTGAQIAMQLLRQSWSNRSMKLRALELLQSVGRLGRHMAAGLSLLTEELQLSATQLYELHFPYGAPEDVPPPPILSSDDATAYLQERLQFGGTNPRLLLTPGEEKRVLGCQRATPPVPSWLRMGQFNAIEVPECPIGPEVVPALEKGLCGLVNRSLVNVLPAYPLSLIGSTPLEGEMHGELEESWNAHHSYAAVEVLTLGARDLIFCAQVKVNSLVDQMQEYLEHHLVAVPSDVGCHGTAFRMTRLSAAEPTPNFLDFVRISMDQHLAQTFNPFLTAVSCERLQRGARRWLELCVLQDRLQRIMQLLDQVESMEQNAGQQALLLRELQVHRTWGIEEYPEWLVFEAEGSLQIRPNQYQIAKDLMNRPGAVEQLNMGEGKTRVIMPMLVLHWVKTRKTLVRLNLLPALLEEGFAYLHLHLCSSVLGRKLFVQPFQRDVILTPQTVRAMQAALNYCQQEGGLLLVAPEHRLSLELKWQELWEQGRKDLCTQINGIRAMPCTDILDECDELLNHRFQLIYAWGTRTDLPSLPSRARAAQTLLQIISQQAQQGQGTLGTALRQAQETVVVATGVEHKPGAFYGLRLLPGEALEVVLPMLHRELAEAVFDSPPYEMRWMKGHPLKGLLIECMTDGLLDANDVLSSDAVAGLSEKEVCDVLAFRGLLACQLLAHGLRMRHKVEYGVSRLESARKRLAVPFRAAQTPSERSEYSQPDSALLLTPLAYYDDGLSEKEFLEALKVLLGLGLSAQQSHYDEWLALTGSDNVPATLDNVSKLDTSNRLQMQEMHALFSHNMGVINFWLNFCVFPAEMQQFPKRLLASPWNLADNANGRVVGFSGTTDNHRLLPLQVRLHTVGDQALHGTNGKMLDIILRNPEYTTLELQDEQPVWQAVLELAVVKGVDALLDCGALLAGVSNKEAAHFVLQRLLHLPRTLENGAERFQGVCYFDTEQRCWCLLDLRGRTMPRHTSRIAERDAFTVYDEARCRGTDLQLRQTAVGLLTLGPNCCKDKLMQAVGRLRQLDRGQTLTFVGTSDITEKIRKLNDIINSSSSSSSSLPVLTSHHMLQWVMHNTVQSTLNGILDWSRQGLHFTHAKDAPQHALMDEVLELADMYGGPRDEQPVPDMVLSFTRKSRSDLVPGLQQLVAVIGEHSAMYGEGHRAVAQGGLNQEVERELEREQEEEEEVEREVPRMEAAAEKDWDYRKAIGAVTLQDISSLTDVRPLSELARRVHPHSVHSIPWDARVYCTANFISTIIQVSPTEQLNEYLRPIDTFLLLPDRDSSRESAIVLISEREANSLLKLMLQSRSAFQGATSTTVINSSVLMHLCYACQAAAEDNSSSSSPRLASVTNHDGRQIAGLPLQSARGQFNLSDCMRQLVSAQLFNGETTYIEPRGRQYGELEELPWLKELHRLVHRQEEAAEALVRMRGKQSLYSRSQLELACSKP